MLYEFLWDLYIAQTDREKSRAFRNLEKLGMDRKTATAMINEISDETWISFGFNPYERGES